MRQKSPLLPIFLIVAVDILGLTIILPLLPFYSEHFGASPFVVGVLVATYAFCQLIAGPALGALSDKIGRRPVLLVSQLGTFIGFLVLANAHALWMVFLSRIIDGATAGNLSIAQAYISDVTDPKNRAKSFGVIGIAFGLGFLIGPALSGYLSQFGFQYPIYLAAALSATSILATYFLLPESAPVRDASAVTKKRFYHYQEFVNRSHLRNFLVQFFLFCFSFSLFNSGFALFAERRLSFHGVPFGVKQVGYIFAYAGLLGIFIQGGLLGRLVAKFGETRIVMLSCVLSGLGYLAIGNSHGIPELVAGFSLMAFGTSLLRPSLTSLITQSVSRHEQGVILGLNQSLQSVAQIVAPLLGGYLIGQGALTLWGVVAALGGFLGLIFMAEMPLASLG